jgi:hypothetical protein
VSNQRLHLGSSRTYNLGSSRYTDLANQQTQPGTGFPLLGATEGSPGSNMLHSSAKTQPTTTKKGRNFKTTYGGGILPQITRKLFASRCVGRGQIITLWMTRCLSVPVAPVSWLTGALNVGLHFADHLEPDAGLQELSVDDRGVSHLSERARDAPPSCASTILPESGVT